MAAEVTHQAVDILSTQTVCHGVGGGRFEVMRLIDDEVVVGRQNAVFGGGICQEQAWLTTRIWALSAANARLVEGAAPAGVLEAVFELTALVLS